MCIHEMLVSAAVHKSAKFVQANDGFLTFIGPRMGGCALIDAKLFEAYVILTHSPCSLVPLL